MTGRKVWYMAETAREALIPHENTAFESRNRYPRERKPNPARDMLSGYRWIIKRRDALLDEINEHYERAYSCTVRLNPSKTTGGSAAYDRMADDVCRAADAKDYLAFKVAQLNEKIAQILAYIEKLPDERQKTVVTLRYVRGMTWEEIQHEMHFEETWVLVLHGRALKRINELMKDCRKVW